MDAKLEQALLWLVAIVFGAVSAWATWEVGYLGILEAGLASGPGALQIFVDLAVACGLGAAWVVRDARARGANPWPWLLGVPLLGSIPLLAYALFRRRLGAAPA